MLVDFKLSVGDWAGGSLYDYDFRANGRCTQRDVRSPRVDRGTWSVIDGQVYVLVDEPPLPHLAAESIQSAYRAALGRVLARMIVT